MYTPIIQEPRKMTHTKEKHKRTAREELWIMVRLQRLTHKRLMEWRAAQAGKEGAGIETDFYSRHSGEISFDACVRELLSRDDAHRQRARKAREKAKQRKRDAKREAKPAQNSDVPVNLGNTK